MVEAEFTPKLHPMPKATLQVFGNQTEARLDGAGQDPPLPHPPTLLCLGSVPPESEPSSCHQLVASLVLSLCRFIFLEFWAPPFEGHFIVAQDTGPDSLRVAPNSVSCP